VAASLLNAVGMPELVADSMAQYEALALHLARTPSALGDMRAKLLRNRTESALFDTPRFVRSLESAYEAMCNRFRHGRAPALIEV